MIHHHGYLKKCCAQLENTITHLNNKSLTQARVLTLCTVHGKHNPNFHGDKKQVINFSLTSVSTKLHVFEKIIRDKMISFLETNKSIIENLHVFHSNGFCLSNLLDFFNDIYMSWDISEQCDMIYLNCRHIE